MTNLKRKAYKDAQRDGGVQQASKARDMLTSTPQRTQVSTRGSAERVEGGGPKINGSQLFNRYSSYVDGWKPLMSSRGSRPSCGHFVGGGKHFMQSTTGETYCMRCYREEAGIEEEGA